jgi:hypothetical protein
MATEEKKIVHPGDIVQVTDPGHSLHSHLLIVTQARPRFIGAIVRWVDGYGELGQNYHRLDPAQVVVCGAAAILPEDLLQARKDSLKTAEEAAREAGQ